MKKIIIPYTITILFFALEGHAQDTWVLKNPFSNPAFRSPATMVSIGDDKALLFSGGYSDDQTWVYDLSDNAWTMKNPSIKPPGRLYHSMVYMGNNKVLMFGGYELNTGYFLNDTWVYDITNDSWTEKNPAEKPSQRSIHAMAYIGDDKVLLFGGIYGSYPFYSQTWMYDLSEDSWTQLHPVTNPSERGEFTMAYIGDDKVLLFGGVYWDFLFENAVVNNETWVFDLSDNTWTEKTPATSPSARRTHAMASLSGDQVILFGGADLDQGIYNNDTWVYDFSDNTWTQKFPATNPGGHFAHAMASLGGNQVLLYGGWGYVSAGLFETWVYTLLSCSNLSVSAGADEHLYYGYAPGQCKTKTALVTGGAAPFTYNWTLNRALLPGETMTGANTASVTVCLMDTAELCVNVTDAAGCTANDCATMLAEDVRCSAGNNINKVRICHSTNSATNPWVEICVANEAVPAHLAHGDYVGSCNTSKMNPADLETRDDIEPRFQIYPNPAKKQFIIELNKEQMTAEKTTIRIMNSAGQLVKEIFVGSQSRLNVSLGSPGLYIIQIRSGVNTTFKKLIIE